VLNFEFLLCVLSELCETRAVGGSIIKYKTTMSRQARQVRKEKPRILFAIDLESLYETGCLEVQI